MTGIWTIHQTRSEAFAPLRADLSASRACLPLLTMVSWTPVSSKSCFHDFLIGGVVFRHQDADVMEQRRFHRRGLGMQPPGVGHEAGLVERDDGFVQPRRVTRDRMATCRRAGRRPGWIRKGSARPRARP